MVESMEISRARMENVVQVVADALGTDLGLFEQETIDGAVDAAIKALQPRGTGYLNCMKDSIQVCLFHVSDEQKGKSRAAFKTMDELVEWCRKWNVDGFMCSSSMDFPEEYTDKPEIIALCREIRA